MPELTNKLIGLTAIRVLVVVSVLLSWLIQGPSLEDGTDGPWVRIVHQVVQLVQPDVPLESEEGPPPPRSNDTRIDVVQWLVATVSVQTLLYLALLKPLRRRQVLQAWIQLAGDLLLVTLLVYKFGGVTANLSILYLVVISVGSFLLRGRSGLVVAAAAMVLYTGVILAHQSSGFHALWHEGGPLAPNPTLERLSGERVHLDVIERISSWLQPPDVEEISGVPAAYSLAVHFVGFFVVALFTTHLSRDQALERKLAERSHDLAELQTLHRDVIQSISSGLAATDLDGRVTSLNRAGAEILGLRAADLVGRHITDTDLFDEEGWRRLTRESGRGMLRSELAMEHDGATVHVGFSLSHLRDGDGRHLGYILIFQDLTEWRRLQEQVRVQDRMAAIGQMAAGLAHEVGNPLAAISGSVQMLARTTEPTSSQAKLIEITVKESQRLDRTVKDFLRFARPRERHLERFDIASLLAEDVQLLRNSDEVLPGHEIRLELVPESAEITAELDQVGQLFWNLARNALQAMPDGGRLTVSGELDGEVYRIRFRDTGKGMSEEERSNLFQPFKSFFDDGMGLGMAIVYRIVEEHGGDIQIDSEPGRGTVITVELPVRAGGEVPATPLPEPSPREVAS